MRNAGAALPDGRVYERITPNGDKGGADLFGGQAPAGISSTDGNKLLFQSASPLPGTTVGVPGHYVASRGANGWSSVSVIPSTDKGGAFYLARLASPDLSKVATKVFTSGSPFDNRPMGAAVGPPGGPYDTVASNLSGLLFPGTTLGDIEVVGASRDLSHVVFATVDTSLDPVAAAGWKSGRNLYMWSDGQIELLSVKTDGSLLDPCGAGLGNSGYESVAQVDLPANAVSADGSRVFMMSPAYIPFGFDPSCSPSLPAQLYVRKDGATTVKVSAAEPGVTDPSGEQTVHFAGAAADGSKVFFRTREWLTPDVSTHDPELYEYDVDTDQLTRISRGDSGTADGNVLWAIVSDDGSTVYFGAQGQLTADSPAADVDHANLYRYDSASGTTTYLAQVSSTDWGLATFQGPDGVTAWYTPPDGKFLLFASTANVTGYDPGGWRQVYRYSAATGDVTCMSCPPAGVTPSGHAGFRAGDSVPIFIQPRPMSDDGSYVFFDTPDPLVPGTVREARSVYEWHDGTVSRISGGHDTVETPYGHGAVFLTTSPDGRDAFFATHEGLVPSDTDDLGDYYDARIGGGFAEAAEKAQCSGDECRGAAAGAPSLPTPSSTTVFGPGNVRSSGAGNVGSSGAGWLRVERIGAKARAAWARTGRLTLTVHVSGRGRVSARATARLGGHVRTVARASKSAARKGTVRITVRLSGAARHALARTGRLRVALEVAFSGASRAQHAVLTLRKGHR